MISKAIGESRYSLRTPRWMIIGSVIILFIIVAVLVSKNYSREKQYMSQILSGKGTALIRAVEAGTHTGMIDMQWGQQQVQSLLEATAKLPGVFFIAVVDPDGVIVAHSDKSRIGSHFDQSLPEIESSRTGGVQWRFVDMDRYGPTFLAYSYFRPVADFPGWMHHGHHGMKMGQHGDWRSPPKRGQEDRIIIGMNPTPFYDARREDIRNSLKLSGILLVLGLAGFLSMFWMHSYQTTKRKLQDTTAFADELVRSLPVGLVATDRSGKIAFCNSAAERITGIDLSKVFGRDPRDILPGNLCELRETLNRGRAVSEEEMECEFTGDRVVPVSISASQIINEEGRFVGQVLIIRDLGEVRRLQAEIRRKEKLAAIGGLAAGVAHEIRNPLSSLKGIASYYRSKFDEGSEDKEMAGVMIEEVDRLSRVISELLEFARPAKLNVKSSPVNDLLAHSVRLVQQEAAAKKIQIQLSPAAGAPMADIDPDRLTQSLLNLYLNAFQAMADGGRLTITGAIETGDRVAIEIRDSGSGMSAEDLSQIFQPYFTTRAKGTGLGLAIVHKIIEAHQGTIKVRSALGQGTVFSITLPLTSTV
jgi:two-component system sensor histidine kinase HydH